MLVLALVVVLVLEAFRIRGDLELPTIRPFERGRLASFAYFALALVAAVLFFPEAIAVAVVLGAALIDPLIGELRIAPGWRSAYPTAPVLAYALIAALALLVVGAWSWPASVLAAVGAAALAIGVERLRYRHLDDDLTMTLVPGIALSALVVLWPGFSALGR